ncbi:TetR/AcrR family transcriptional regulator [Streptomyces uncialis]|nr:TetR/AcrR family transcriptional regulator [Streptomyces uncialis]WST69055.1 TetR/AcrR family transcriptional regulator [Streptomyces uncialis]
MSGEMGLRERKRLRMYRSVSETAIALFLERGFEKVSVAEIAAAADISKPTLFRYFPAKEDLVLHRFADHEDEAARVVTAARADGTAPLAALHRDFLDGLARHDPVTGLNDDPGVLAFHDLLYGTPSLVARLYTYLERSEERLAGALAAPGPPGLPDRTAAAQMVAVRRVLAQENRRRVASGERADAVHPDAVTHADRAFAELRDGLPRYAGA